MEEACSRCHLKSVNKLIAKFQPSLEVSEALQVEAKKILAENAHLPNPYVATYIQRLAKDKMNVASLYREEKIRANTVLLSNYEYWKNYVSESEDPFRTAVKLAMAGNIIDYGAHTAPDDIEASINELIKKDLSEDNVRQLHSDIARSSHILYLGDNAGEIVFDKLLIETMQHPHITYVVRGQPVINDVTFADARQTGIDQLCKVISNGYDAPSTLLEHCSPELIKAYHSADLVISKGQGNFEGLMQAKHPTLYFLLTAKCKPIAQMLDVSEGDLVIKKQG
ncbi:MULTISPECIES: damage-control phosphatase ARMT1 family protein [unclassified Saccharicrinis]|uniref:damage-control phosphatase ARMT1 family protein n=1 Tax=unclassified Saccharicrinis TaxID=2646859 RepID=UPI003D3346CF